MDRHEGKQKKDSHLKWLECHAEERWHPALGMMLRRLERCLYRSETHKTCVEDAMGAGKWARASRRWLWESWSSWSHSSNMDGREKRASCFKLLCFSSSPASVNLLEKLRGVCVYVCSSFSLCMCLCAHACACGVWVYVCACMCEHVYLCRYHLTYLFFLPHHCYDLTFLMWGKWRVRQWRIFWYSQGCVCVPHWQKLFVFIVYSMMFWYTVEGLYYLIYRISHT